ncbi:9477_t:CDS:2 [Paraglomus occultum]|uniref:Peroxidase n=1 Tax=Paraglomus occultum TaxID=144539 RepID=A0A9N9B4P2_9GLOM|nr:9477_t:CDS:2 [Paraglomus occultum]
MSFLRHCRAATRSIPSSRGLLFSASATTPLILRGPTAYRAYSTQAEKKSRGGALIALTALAVGAGAGYYFFSPALSTAKTSPVSPPSPDSGEVNYQKVYNQIADILEDNDWDDGSWGPIFVRLAWHASGTYDKATNTGGSHGATMRFAPESEHAANAGLKAARNKLESVKTANPAVTYSDLWSLAGVVAIQEMGGPTIPWIPGRRDAEAIAATPDGRLPDASLGANHLRDIFYRMGFDDREIVALSGAHALGRCHPSNSGFDGPWTASPTIVTNGYFKELLEKKWVEKKWKGPKQYVDKETGDLMMLPTDLVLIQDRSFRPWVEKYAADEKLWFNDFANAFHKLQELGVPRNGSEKVYYFKRTDEQ